MSRNRTSPRADLDVRFLGCCRYEGERHGNLPSWTTELRLGVYIGLCKPRSGLRTTSFSGLTYPSACCASGTYPGTQVTNMKLCTSRKSFALYGFRSSSSAAANDRTDLYVSQLRSERYVSSN